jgi:group I intron endonuclease
MKGIVYIIRNNINCKVYIGQTVQSLQKRINNYKQELKTRNYGIYAAMNKHGFEKFEFTIIEECFITELDSREQFWITKHESQNQKLGYNIQAGGNKNKTIPSWKKKQLSDNHYSKKPGFVGPNKGKTFSEEWKQNMRKPKNLSPAQLKKNKKVARLANLGRKFTKKHKQKLAKAHEKPILQYTIDNKFVKEWPSIESAYKSLKTSPANISAVLHGRQKTAKGFIWKIK